MPFCCIALIGMAVIYFSLLWLRHLFSGPRRDRASKLPVPPRALTGNGAKPVYGHSWLFQKMGSDLALLFPPDMHEWRWLPKNMSRPLGGCFSVFIWGYWRVIIRGPDLTTKVLDSVGLQEGWAWSPPKNLLGNSCLPLLDDSEADFLASLIRGPLGHDSIVRFAPEFADLAENFIDDLLAGTFRKRNDSPRHGVDSEGSEELSEDDEELGLKWDSHKIKWEALRSFTLDLISGPVLKLSIWESDGERNEVQAAKQRQGQVEPEKKTERRMHVLPQKKKSPHRRELVLLWMERVKAAMLAVKMTWGAEWAQMWRLNEYGRAVNGRMHLEKLLSRHVAKQQLLVPVPREAGHTFHEPMAMPFPWITMAENMYFHYRKFQITGPGGRVTTQNRPRTQSAPDILQDESSGLSQYFDIPPPPSSSPRPLETEQDLHHAEYVSSPATSPRHSSFKRFNSTPEEVGRKRLNSTPVDVGRKKHPKSIEIPVLGNERKKPERRRVMTLLEQFLQQKDSEGTGMTRAVVSETCFLLWMMMDVGNAWTAMALHLLASEESACSRVQEELDHLVNIYGKDNIYVPSVLNKMHALDAVLSEAIRLCPPFLGGMKKTSQTMELPEMGVQIPKNTNVVFCQPTEEPFDMDKAMGKRPQQLGVSYPCVELHGFLPFQGMEVPIMVLQSKVLLAVLMQRCSPFLSKRRTFIRKVKETLQMCSPVRDSKDEELGDNFFNEEVGDLNDAHDTVVDEEDTGIDVVHPDMTQTEAMRLFTKIPFPEPRRVIHVKLREGVA